MKHLLLLLIAMSTFTFYSCKETEETSSVNNGQDRDSDIITGDDYVYHLPVVFHVFYKDKNDPTQYISQNRLKELINNVNELYQGVIYTEMLDTVASENIHVQFELANYNEDGTIMGTPGVEYIPYPDGNDSIDCNTFMHSKKYAKYNWDPNNYINVMVYNFKTKNENETTLGISNLPYQAAGYPEIEGLASTNKYPLKKSNLSYPYCISINAIYASRDYEGTRYTTDKNKKKYSYMPTDPNATLAHELGHFLGLKHAFTELEDDDDTSGYKWTASSLSSSSTSKSTNKTETTDPCEDTDYCEDTPSYDRSAYFSWLTTFIANARKINPDTTFTLTQLVVRENNKGETWKADNFMDYSYCYNTRFTPNQANRMRQVLYYSPLIPGPKKERTKSRAYQEAPEGPLDLPIVLSKERTIRTQDIHKREIRTRQLYTNKR